MDELETGIINLYFIDGNSVKIKDFQYYTMQGPFLVVAKNDGSTDHYNADQIAQFVYTPKETN